MSDSEFLSASDLHILTGYARAAEQESWLKEHGLPHRRDGRRIIMARFHARAWLEGRAVRPSNEPNLGALGA
jgi:hypothetical protein